jgi:hypothetical protein
LVTLLAASLQKCERCPSVPPRHPPPASRRDRHLHCCPCAAACCCCLLGCLGSSVEASYGSVDLGAAAQQPADGGRARPRHCQWQQQPGQSLARSELRKAAVPRLPPPAAHPRAGGRVTQGMLSPLALVKAGLGAASGTFQGEQVCAVASLAGPTNGKNTAAHSAPPTPAPPPPHRQCAARSPVAPRRAALHDAGAPAPDLRRALCAAARAAGAASRRPAAAGGGEAGGAGERGLRGLPARASQVRRGAWPLALFLSGGDVDSAGRRHAAAAARGRDVSRRAYTCVPTAALSAGLACGAVRAGDRLRP